MSWSSSVPLIGIFEGTGNRIVDADDAFVRILGYERERFAADRAAGRRLSPPEWQEIDEAALRRAAVTGGASAPYQKEFWHADGHRVPVLVTFTLDRAQPDRWVGCAVDLSAPVSSLPPDGGHQSDDHPGHFVGQLVGELVRERSRIASMLDGTTALVWSVDRELRLLAANEAFREVQRAELGRELHHGDHVVDAGFRAAARTAWEERYGRALAGESFDVREEHLGRTFDFRFSPLRDVAGEIVAAVVFGVDVTAETEAIGSLRQREQLLRIAGRLGRVAAWTIDVATRRVTLSAELVELFGLAVATGDAVDLADTLAFYRRADRPAMLAAIERCIADGTPIDLELRIGRGDGRPAWVRVMGEARRDEHGHITDVHGAIADITSQRTIQGRVREQASLLDHATDAILVRDLDGIVSYWNRAAEALYGWTAAEAVGRHIADLVDAGDMDKYAEMEDEIFADGEWSGRMENTDRYGNRVIIELHISTIPDDEGHPIALFSIASDITERVQLEERLARAQKLEAVGQLTGGLAHDFNNLLTVISGSSELLADAVAGDGQLMELVELISSAAERGADLTRRLLAYARRQPLHPASLDPVAVIEQVLGLLRRSFPEAIAITVDASRGDGRVDADPGQLETALMNVALNARDAMRGRGELGIRVDTVVLEADPDLEIAPGEYLRITVTDDGPGMPPEIAARAFDPFFTTKPTGEGTGLGLSMVYGFVRQSGGHVELRSEPGVGTAVELLLPRSSADAAPVVEQPDAAVPVGDERILVVEDDPLVRGQTVRVLTRLGYDVVEAADGTTAIARLERGRFDLVFSDVVMPGPINGFELADQVARRWPGTPVLLTSGYADVDRGTEHDRPVPLPKPYRRSELAHALRDALDARS